jgi:hypothetical protein
VTEEKALEFWRALAPTAAVVSRYSPLADSDPVKYEVRIHTANLQGKRFAQVLKLAEAHGLELGLDGGVEPWVLFTEAKPPLIHPAAPKS